MTDDEKVAAITAIIGADDPDIEANPDLPKTYLALAKDAIMQRSYPLVSDRTAIGFPARYDGLSVRLAVAMWARRGAEGESTHNENGVQRTYEDGDSLLSEVVPHARAIGGGQ